MGPDGYDLGSRRVNSPEGGQPAVDHRVKLREHALTEMELELFSVSARSGHGHGDRIQDRFGNGLMLEGDFPVHHAVSVSQ